MKLYGFMPDVDTTTDGVITDCQGAIPSLRGMRGAPSPVTTTQSALASTCMGAATLLKLDGSNRFFAGTATDLYEASISGFSSVTRTAGAGGSYATATGRWRFCQFGNVSIASNKQNAIQASQSSVFADIPTAPSADIVDTVNQFVMAVNTNDVTFGDSPDRWWCSALSDYTNWTPSQATQSASGRLTSVPGKITAGRRFGDGFAIYKRLGIYLGVYTGPPFIWSFQELQGVTGGAFCQEAVLNVGTDEQPKHFFVGPDGFFTFDGARPSPVGVELKSYFLRSLNQTAAEMICMVNDRVNSLVYVYYPSGSSLIPDACLVWNYRTNRWGADSRQIEFAMDFLAPGLNYGQVGTYYTLYSDLPVAPYGSGFLSASQLSPAIFNTSHRVQTLTGGAGDGYIVGPDIGEEMGMTLVSRVKPRWFTKPSVSTLTNFYRQSLGDDLSQDSPSQMSNSRFDLTRSARWHRLKISMTGDFELNQVDVMSRPNGRE